MTVTVRDETLAALTTAGIIREVEREGFSSYLDSNNVNVGDILPVMAKLRGIEEGAQSSTVAGWGRAIAPIVKKRYSLIPFAEKLLGSSNLFEKYSTILEAASAVRCPLIFSEDTDVLGFGTINPVAGLHLSSFVADYFEAKTGMTPYLSMFLLDLSSWETICRRQFEQ
ncbi:MAG: hypothetical protein ACSHYB_13435 [Roseibacillus sp.]